jgi:hypothetical protein
MLNSFIQNKLMLAYCQCAWDNKNLECPKSEAQSKKFGQLQMISEFAENKERCLQTHFQPSLDNI